MTDSDYKPGSIPDSESQEMTEEKKDWLNNLPSKKDRYIEPTDLPRWSKIAMAKYKLGQYETWKEAAEDNDRTAGTLYNYRATPAGEEYLKRFDDYLDNPSKMAETLLRGELHGFTLDFMSMWQTAVDSNDYTEVRKMWETIMDRVPGGMSKRGGDSGVSPSIEINLIGDARGDAEFDMIEAEWEEVDED